LMSYISPSFISWIFLSTFLSMALEQREYKSAPVKYFGSC
jgi:hypothetical protein